MSLSLQDLGIDRLSPEERLRLIGDIWDSISDSDQTEIPQSHREELDRRLADASACAGASWEEVRARLRGNP
jgi:putative addiction module component (TIGR02574 family)